jgi:hypothetical protein
MTIKQDEKDSGSFGASEKWGGPMPRELKSSDELRLKPARNED